MKLTGNLKKQVEQTESKEEARKVIRQAGMELTDEELDQVSGGAIQTVRTGSSRAEVIRSGPGITYSQICSLGDGEKVYTTGQKVRNDEDGIIWVEIAVPVHGWIRGFLIGH